jgi:amidase
MTSAIEMAAAVRSQSVSSRELVTASLAAIAAAASGRAFLVTDDERALAAADAIDAAVADGEEVGPLGGVPIGIKDLPETARLATTYGSLAFAGNVPDEDAVLVRRLRAAGAIVVGKTSTPAFGWLGETKNALGADCVNPRDPTRTPGGSSGARRRPSPPAWCRSRTAPTRAARSQSSRAGRRSCRSRPPSTSAGIRPPPSPPGARQAAFRSG